jgi:hypothetical protein
LSSFLALFAVDFYLSLEQEHAQSKLLAANMMQSFTATYVDWKDYFKRRFTASGTFYLAGYRRDKKTEVEIYASSVAGFKTTIEIGYGSPLRLLFSRILNPFTPGLNKHQEQHYFSQNDFYPHISQNGAGLEFDDFNVRGIDDYLSQGFEGSEIVFVKNGKPAKSILKSNTFPWTNDTLTFYFDKAQIVDIKKGKSAEEDSYDQKVEIELNTIYSGTQHS